MRPRVLGATTKLAAAVLLAASAVVGRRLSPYVFSDEGVDWLNDTIEQFIRKVLVDFGIDVSLFISIVLVVLKYADPVAAWLFRLVRDYDRRAFRAIRKARPFDPLRGLDGHEQDRAHAVALPFDRTRIGDGGNAARTEVWRALERFVRPQQDKASLRSEVVSDFGWVLVTGPSGLGKSRLVMEFARALGQREAFGGEDAPASLFRRMSNAVKTALGASGARDPWDVGWLQSGPAGYFSTPLDLDGLRKWSPRRPTLLMLDDPRPGEAGKVVEALGGLDHTTVVRLVVVSPTPPADLLKVDGGVQRVQAARCLGDPIVLGEGARFDVDEVIDLSHSADFRSWLPAAIRARAPTKWGDVYRRSVVQMLRDCDGNPFLLECLLAEMKAGDVAVDEAIDGPSLRRRRAVRLLDAILEAGFPKAGLPLVAAASLAGGVDALDLEQRRSLFALFAAEWKPETDGYIAQIDSGSSDQKRGSLHIPIVRPRLLGLNFVRAVVDRAADKAALANHIVSAAWAISPTTVLKEAIAARAEGINDALSRRLKEGPPKEARVSDIDLLKAYIDAAFVVPRADWEFAGQSLSLAPLREDAVGLTRSISAAAAMDALAYLVEKSMTPRVTAIFRATEAYGLMADLADRLGGLATEPADGVDDFWRLYDATSAIAENWGIATKDPHTDRLIASIRALLPCAPALMTSPDMKPEIKHRLWKLINGPQSYFFYFVIRLFATHDLYDMTKYYSKPENEIDDLVSFIVCREGRYSSLDNNINAHVSAAVRARAQDIELSEPSADPFDLLLAIFSIASLPRDRVASAFSTTLERIRRCESDGKNEVVLRAHVAFCARVTSSDRETCHLFLKESDIAEPQTSNDLSAAILLDKVAVIVEPDRSPEDIGLLDLSSFIHLAENKYCSASAIAETYGLMHVKIGKYSDAGRDEGSKFREAYDYLVDFARMNQSRWIGHDAAEAMFGRLMSGRARAYRFHPSRTRDFAYEVEDRFSQRSDTFGAVYATVEAWRIHAFALSQQLTLDAVDELSDVVKHIDAVNSPFSYYYITANAAILAHEYRILALRKMDICSGEAMIQMLSSMKSYSISTDIHRSIWDAIRNTWLSSAVGHDTRQSCLWHLRLGSIHSGRLEGGDFVDEAGQDAGEARALHLAILPILLAIVRSEAPLNRRSATLVGRHLTRTIALAGLQEEPAAEEVSAQAADILSRAGGAANESRVLPAFSSVTWAPGAEWLSGSAPFS